MLIATPLHSASLQQSGGAIFAHSGTLTLHRTTVSGNTATEGGGISLSGGSRLTAKGCSLGGNLLSGGSSGPGAGADLLLVDGEHSAAYLQPMPSPEAASGERENKTLVTGRCFGDVDVGTERFTSCAAPFLLHCTKEYLRRN